MTNDTKQTTPPAMNAASQNAELVLRRLEQLHKETVPGYWRDLIEEAMPCALAVVRSLAAPVAERAAAPASVPEGYKLAPAEPTDRMTYIGQSMRYESANSIGTIYRAMISAAPEVAQPAAQGELGGILAYTTRGHNKPCGQTMGANGAGDFAIIFHGTPEQADEAARCHVRELERAGYRMDSVVFVPNEEGYHGPAIKHSPPLATPAPTAGEPSARTDELCNSALRAEPAGQHDAAIAVLSAVRDGIPLQEPVNITKAVLAQREARVSLSGGTGPVACAMLVNIQLTGWAEGPETAKAFAGGYNTAIKWFRASLLDLADKVSAAAATRSRAEGGITCPKCGVDRIASPCPTPSDCGMIGTAHIKATQDHTAGEPSVTATNFCLLIDELLMSWLSTRGNSPENRERRLNARSALETAIKATQGGNEGGNV